MQKEKQLVIGVDIGMGGAIALFDQRMGKIITIDDMPTIKGEKGRRKLDGLGVFSILNNHKRQGARMIVIEDLHVMFKNGAFASFSVGHGKGFFEGVSIGLDLEVIMISPQRWKKHYGLIKVAKEGAIQVAKDLHIGADRFLTRKMDHDRADAALLAALPCDILNPLG